MAIASINPATAGRDTHLPATKVIDFAELPERTETTMAGLLLSAPEQPVRFGAGDLSFYKDIATMDAGPGLLNGNEGIALGAIGAIFVAVFL